PFSRAILLAASRKPPTSLPRIKLWSARRESNPRPTAWKAVTLPLSYSRSNCPAFSISEVLRCAQDLGGGLKRPPIASTWKAVTLPLSYSRPHCHFTLARSFTPLRISAAGSRFAHARKPPQVTPAKTSYRLSAVSSQ